MHRSSVKALVVLLGLFVIHGAAAADETANAARDHFKKGTKAYDLGRYLEAAHEYEAAYELKDDPALLFNIAQAYRLGGDSVDAIRAYKSFVERRPARTTRCSRRSKLTRRRLIRGAR
jgi:tetratricopeptide (TPR) repeat protein